MTTNTALWTFGLLLQFLLLATLFFRRQARSLPFFTTLIAFYLLRSILLFALFGYIDPPAYDLTYTTLSSLDLLLQVAVAWELLAFCEPRPLRTRAGIFVALFLASAANAWLLSILLPASVRIPVDRSVLFSSTLMLAVFLASSSRLAPTLPARVLRGFALLATAGILTQIGRTVAAANRSARALTYWSWLEPAAYLAVLVFWLAVAGARGGKEQHSALSAIPNGSQGSRST